MTNSLLESVSVFDVSKGHRSLTHTHTCSEQSLRILMWNASYVHKHPNYTWQEWVRDKTRDRIKKFPFPKPLLDARTKPNRYLLDRLRNPYRHWSDVKWKTESLVGKLFEKRHAGLGLAGCHWREIAKLKLFCRYVTRRPWWYPRIIWGASLDGAAYVLSIPLPLQTGKIRSFTSIQMVHTLDKNGSLYDPAGTESWNMQIRYETKKLTMHPTNNRSSPDWFSCPRSSSKIHRRRGFDKIIQIHRRHGRRNNPENQKYCRRHGSVKILRKVLMQLN